MEHIKTCRIKGVGDFEYYLTKTETLMEDNIISTYGVAIRDTNNEHVETVNDIWSEKEAVVEFIRLIAKNGVTCIHLRELCEEFAEELYLI